MQISIDEDMLDDLLQVRLASDYKMLKDEFLNPSSIPMYSLDSEIDREMMFSLIQAIRKVHNYYATYGKKILY
jgi:hypothetical protein